MTDPAALNLEPALLDRKAAGRITWLGPSLMLFARSIFAVAAQGLIAAIYALQGSSSPWPDAAAWLPVHGTLIDLGCLAMLSWLTRREGIGLADLVGFDRKRFGPDILLGLALVPPCLFFILAGIWSSSMLVYGNLDAPQIFSPLPLWAALYAVLVFPLIWGVVEQTTYDGYLLPRIKTLSGSTPLAVAVVAHWLMDGASAFSFTLLPLLR